MLKTFSFFFVKRIIQKASAIAFPSSTEGNSQAKVKELVNKEKKF